MLVLGSSPKWLGAPREHLGGGGQLGVDLEADDQLPAGRRRDRCRRTRPSRRGHAARSPPSGRRADAGNMDDLAERRGQHLDADGQAVGAGAEGHRHGGVAGQVGRDRADVVEVHGERVGGLGAERERGGGRGRRQQHVEALVGGGEVAADQRADLLGLAVEGVVVAGRQGVGAEHDPALHLGAEARRCGWRPSSRWWSARRPAGRSARRRSGPGCSTPRPGRSGSRRTGRR